MKWCIVGCGTGALWDLGDLYIGGLKKCDGSLNKITNISDNLNWRLDVIKWKCKLIYIPSYQSNCFQQSLLAFRIARCRYSMICLEANPRPAVAVYIQMLLDQKVLNTAHFFHY